jgi:hypothetical protein
VHPVEGGVGGFGEGSPAALALVAAFFLRVDHDVILAKTTVGTTARIVTPLLARVHADTSLVWRSETKQGWRRTRTQFNSAFIHDSLGRYQPLQRLRYHS